MAAPKNAHCRICVRRHGGERVHDNSNGIEIIRNDFTSIGRCHLYTYTTSERLLPNCQSFFFGCFDSELSTPACLVRSAATLGSYCCLFVTRVGSADFEALHGLSPARVEGVPFCWACWAGRVRVPRSPNPTAPLH